MCGTTYSGAIQSRLTINVAIVPMSSNEIRLPADHAIVVLQEVGSTNTEAMRRAAAGEYGPLWVMARRQTSGRGEIGQTMGIQGGKSVRKPAVEQHLRAGTGGINWRYWRGSRYMMQP